MQEKNKDFGLPQGGFEPIESGRGKWLKITAIILGFVISVSAGIVYWFFYHSPSTDLSTKVHSMHEKHESQAPEADVDSINDNESVRHHAVEQHTETPKLAKELDTLAGKENTQDFNTSHTAQPRQGTITRINTPRGCYYVVMGSFIDEDLASDYANLLAQKGIDVMFIAPPQGQYFFRVAIEQKDTFYDATEKVKALKEEYGTDIWVMKY